MKYALITTQLIVPVDSEEEAAELALKCQAAGRLNLVAAIEREGASMQSVHEAGLRLLGVSVAVWDTEPTEAYTH